MTTPIYNQRVRQKDSGVSKRQIVLLDAAVAVDIGYLLCTVAGYGDIPAAANHATGTIAGVCLEAAVAVGQGSAQVTCEDGQYDFKNSGANPCTQANVGQTVYAEDFQTIGSLSTAGPPAGKLMQFNAPDAMPSRPCRVSIKID